MTPSEIANYLVKWRIDIWLQILLILIILLIAVFSFYLLYKNRRFMVENTTFHTIENLYSLFHKLSLNYNDWRLSHLFCVTPSDYEKTCNKIINSFKNIPENELEVTLIEHQIREENMIINIMLFYEQVYFQLKHSKNITVRREFLKIIDIYFRERLLLNPRIMSFILKSNAGRELHLEEESALCFADRLETLYDPDYNNKTKIDDNGPFLNDFYAKRSFDASKMYNCTPEIIKNWRNRQYANSESITK